MSRKVILGTMALAVLLGAAWFGGRWWLFASALRAGREHLQQRDYAKALAACERALELRPNNAEARLLAARAARLDGQVAVARSHLQRRAELGVRDTDQRLEDVLLISVSDGLTPLDEAFLVSHLERCNTDEALLILETLVRVYVQTYRLGDALKSLERWLELEPKSAQAYLLRGTVRHSLGHLDDGIADLRRAVSLDPELDTATIRLALALLGRQPRESARLLGPIYERLPGNREVTLGLAQAKLEEDPTSALPLLTRWLETHPDDAAALSLRGRVAMAQRNWQEAETYLLQSREADPYDRETLHLLAQCWKHMNKHADSAKLNDRIKKLEAEEKALREWVRQAGERPDDPAPRYELGRLCQRNGQPDEALRWFSGALVCDPTHAASHSALAKLYEERGNRERAAWHRAQAGEQ